MKQANQKDVPVASTEEIVSDLREFFKTDQSRTTVGRLREMFDTIEKLRDGGMSLENIRLVLDKNNLKIGLPTLTKSLQRIRAEREAKTLVGKVVVAPAKAMASPVLLDDKNKVEKETDSKTVSRDSDLIRPAGITSAAWNEMQVKNAKKNRK